MYKKTEINGVNVGDSGRIPLKDFCEYGNSVSCAFMERDSANGKCIHRNHPVCPLKWLQTSTPQLLIEGRA